MDLHVLAADKNVEFALRGILARHAALGIREIDFEIEVHAGRDGGVRSSGADMLSLEHNRFDASLMVLDFEGSGTDAMSSTELEQRLDQDLLRKVGGNSKAIVIDPECDMWVWGSDNSLSEILNWQSELGIRPWLNSKGFEFSENGKPIRPKEAIEKVFREIRKPRSSSTYRNITSRISLERCVDPAFNRLRETLKIWFPE